MGKSNIEWTDMVWNPVTGCTKVSPGCHNCYAERMAMRFTGHFNVTCHPDRLDQPLHWKKPRRIFVCSMGDLFHEDVPSIVPGNYSFIDRIFGIMALCTQHDFLILTKRPKRMADYCNQWEEGMGRTVPIPDGQSNDFLQPWPLPNVWLGVTVESPDYLWRIDELVKIPAAKRFVSIEPMLEEISVLDYLYEDIDWAIIGAESGPHRRPCEIEDIRNVAGQCILAGIPFFIKQLHIDGKLSKNMDEWPEDLRVREFPE